MSFFANIVKFLSSEYCICCDKRYDLREQKSKHTVIDLIEEVISNRYDDNYFSDYNIILNKIFDNNLSESYKKDIDRLIYYCEIMPRKIVMETANKEYIESTATSFICDNCWERIAEFDEKYKNALINKSKVKLYNTYYNKDFSYLKGDCFSYNSYRLPKPVIYDKVRFLTAYYGYDVAYNVVYDNCKVTGVMAKNIR